MISGVVSLPTVSSTPFLFHLISAEQLHAFILGENPKRGQSIPLKPEIFTHTRVGIRLQVQV